MKPATLLSLALLTVGANANIFPTEPVAATTWNGGDNVKLQWKDDDKAPQLSELNDLTVELMTGTNTNQTSLSVIGKGIKGIAGTLDYTVPKDLGRPGKFYFVRFNQGKNFVWSTIFDIQKITPKATDPQTTTSKAPEAPKTSEAPKAEAPKTTEAPKAAYDNPPKPSASTSPPAASAAAATTTPTPASASEAIGISPSSLMSIAIGGVAFIFTYMY